MHFASSAKHPPNGIPHCHVSISDNNSRCLKYNCLLMIVNTKKYHNRQSMLVFLICRSKCKNIPKKLVIQLAPTITSENMPNPILYILYVTQTSIGHSMSRHAKIQSHLHRPSLLAVFAY